MDTIISAIFASLPLLLLAFVIRWVRLIKINTEIQVKQNKHIISLLEEMISKTN